MTQVKYNAEKNEVSEDSSQKMKTNNPEPILVFFFFPRQPWSTSMSLCSWTQKGFCYGILRTSLRVCFLKTKKAQLLEIKPLQT